MARPVTSTRPRVEHYHSINLDWLRRHGIRQIGHRGQLTWTKGDATGSIGYVLEARGLRVRYQVKPAGDEQETVDELLPITQVPQPLGGVRHFFMCPACRRRCCTLLAGARFRCRQCRQAVYSSQYEGAPTRISGIRWRLRERMYEQDSWNYRTLALDDGLGPKPRNMHWRTFRRIEARDAHLECRWNASVGRWLERTAPTRTRK